MSRILFITSNRIGDAILSTGALEEAQRRLPEASVVVACGPLAEPLFRATPNLETIHLLYKVKGRWTKLWRALKSEDFDLAVDLRGSLITNFLRIKDRIVYRKGSAPMHKTREMAALMGVEGALSPAIYLDAKARADAASILGGAGPIIALAPGANFIGKRWAPENFADVARRLAGLGAQGPLPGATVALLGGPADKQICDEIAESLEAGFCSVLNTVGQIDLLAAGALLQRAALFIGNDSGLMHLAAAMGTPTLGLFGPSDDRVYGPVGAHTRVVRGPRTYERLMADMGYAPLVTQSLLDDIPPSKVISTACELLEETGAWAKPSI